MTEFLEAGETNDWSLKSSAYVPFYILDSSLIVVIVTWICIKLSLLKLVVRHVHRSAVIVTTDRVVTDIGARI